MAFGVEVAKRRQTQRVAVGGLRVGEVVGTRQKGDVRSRHRQVFDVGVVGAGRVRQCLVDVRADGGDAAGRAAHGRPRAVAGLRAAGDVVEQRADDHIAMDIRGAGSGRIGVLLGVEIGSHVVDAHAHAADNDLMAADVGDGVARGDHFRGHVAHDGQAAVAAEAGAALDGGLGVCGVGRAGNDAGAQAAGSARFSVGPHGVGVAHRYIAIDDAVARAGLELGLEGARGVGDDFKHGDVDQAYIPRGNVDVGHCKGGGVVEHLRIAGDLEGRALDIGDGRRRDAGLGAARLPADQRDFGAAVAADLRRGGRIVLRSVLVEAGDHRQARALDVAALDDGLVRAGNVAGRAVDGDVHAADADVDTLNIGKGFRRGRGGDGDIARGDEVARRDGNAVAVGRADAGAGVCVVRGVGDVRIDIRHAEAEAVARLRGDGLRVGVIGGVNIDVVRGNAAGGNRLEIALCKGFQHIHADAYQIERAVRALHGRQRIGVAHGVEVEVARQGQRRAVDEGVVGGVGAGDGRVGHSRHQARVRRSAVRAEIGLGHGVLALVEFGVDVCALRGQVHILHHGRLRGADFSAHDVRSDARNAHLQRGLVHDRLGQRLADRMHVHPARRERAQPADPGVGDAVGIGDGHVDRQGGMAYIDARRRGREFNVRIGGVVHAHGDIAGFVLRVTLGNLKPGVEAALRVADGDHHAGADNAEALVGDLGLGVRVALGIDGHRAGGGEGRRSEQRHRGGAAVSDGHIGLRVNQRAAAGKQFGRRSHLLIFVQVGKHRNAARLDVCAIQFGALLIAQHGDRHRSRHRGGGADVHAGHLRACRGLAVGEDPQRVAGDQVAVSEDGSDVARVVVGNGAVYAERDRTHIASDRLCDGLGAVFRAFAACVDLDGVCRNRHARRVDDGTVVRTQVHIADRDAHRDVDAQRGGGQEGLGLDGVVGVDGDVAGCDVGAADAGNAVCLVEHQKHVAVYGGCASRQRKHGGKRVAVEDVVLDDEVVCNSDLAGSRAGRALRGVKAFRRRADVGQHRR